MSYSAILVPVMPGHSDDGTRAVETARSILAPGGRITVVTVFEESPYYLSMETYGTLPRVHEDDQPMGLAMQEEFTAPDVEVLVRHGQPTRVILDLAQERGHDCIVIPASQPGWQHIFLGSTASAVVRHAHCSVLVLRHPVTDAD